MKLNAYEKMMVNNPVRARMVERNLRTLRRWLPEHRFDEVLEIGCGFGSGVRAIDRTLHPKSITAFDLDEDMVDLARKRTAKAKARTELLVADGEHMPFDDGRFDLAVEMTIFHHIPDWRAAIRETARCLRPGGVFYFEDLTRPFFYESGPISWVMLNYTDHPWDTIPDRDAFVAAMQQSGLTVLRLRDKFVPGWLDGVAVKS